MNREKKEKLRAEIYAVLSYRMPKIDPIEMAYHVQAILDAIEKVL